MGGVRPFGIILYLWDNLPLKMNVGVKLPCELFTWLCELTDGFGVT